tara:strand:+ start:179 stop:385 length:207 start_codon:yes stop_codon:yes gene_type:complete
MGWDEQPPGHSKKTHKLNVANDKEARTRFNNWKKISERCWDFKLIKIVKETNTSPRKKITIITETQLE